MSTSKPSENPVESAVHYRGDCMVAEETVGYLIKLLHQSLHREIDRQMAPLDLTAMQWRPIAILALGQADNPVELARRLGVDTGAMTRTLDRLEAKGLLRRVRNQQDRRMVRLELTEEGLARAKHIPYALAEAQNLHLRGISSEELARFNHLIRRMLANGAPPC